MKRPEDWDQVRSYENRKQLPPGGYVCEVKKCEEVISSTGKPMVKVALEIAEGEYKGYFMDELEHAKQFKSDAKWPYQGTKWILTQDDEGNTNRLLKGFVTSIEAENVKVSWDDNFGRSVQGAQLGVVFGNVESEYNGIVFWRAEPKFFCSCEDIRTNNYNIPKDKPLGTPGASLKDLGDPTDSFKAVEEDIPF